MIKRFKVGENGFIYIYVVDVDLEVAASVAFSPSEIEKWPLERCGKYCMHSSVPFDEMHENDEPYGDCNLLKKGVCWGEIGGGYGRTLVNIFCQRGVEAVFECLEKEAQILRERIEAFNSKRKGE